MPHLILIPGLLCNDQLWRAQLPVLRASAAVSVPAITAQPSIPAMAEAILRGAPERFSLAGFSLGSQIALEIVRIARARVNRLALLSATHGGLLPPVEVALRHAIATIAAGGFDQYLDAAYPSYVAPRRANDVALKRTFVEMAHAVGPDAGMRQMQALLAIPGAFSDLDQIRCPTLIVGGRDDKRTSPAAHELLAKEIPSSQLLLVDDAAHFTPLEQPAAITEALMRWMLR